MCTASFRLGFAMIALLGMIDGCAQAAVPVARTANHSAAASLTATPTSSPLAAPSSAPAATSTPFAQSMPRAVPQHVAIPAIGVSAPVVPLGLTETGALQVPSSVTVTGWYRRGPTPGEPGPAVIVGHVDSRATGPGVFYRLKVLRRGAEVIVRRADGRTAVFVVDRMEEAAKDAFPTAAVYGPTPDPQLRLITCGGAFDAATGHYQDNVIVFAHLAG